VSLIQLGDVKLGSLEELDLADKHILEGIDVLGQNIKIQRL
jgi:hypothetical protein